MTRSFAIRFTSHEFSHQQNFANLPYFSPLSCFPDLKCCLLFCFSFRFGQFGKSLKYNFWLSGLYARSSTFAINNAFNFFVLRLAQYRLVVDVGRKGDYPKELRRKPHTVIRSFPTFECSLLPTFQVVYFAGKPKQFVEFSVRIFALAVSDDVYWKIILNFIDQTSRFDPLNFVRLIWFICMITMKIYFLNFDPYNVNFILIIFKNFLVTMHHFKNTTNATPLHFNMVIIYVSYSFVSNRLLFGTYVVSISKVLLF